MSSSASQRLLHGAKAQTIWKAPPIHRLPTSVIPVFPPVEYFPIYARQRLFRQIPRTRRRAWRVCSGRSLVGLRSPAPRAPGSAPPNRQQPRALVLPDATGSVVPRSPPSQSTTIAPTTLRQRPRSQRRAERERERQERSPPLNEVLIVRKTDGGGDYNTARLHGFVAASSAATQQHAYNRRRVKSTN